MIIIFHFVGVGKTAITIMKYNKILSNDFIETTFAELHKNGHTMSNLKSALRCIKIILEYVDTKYIEHFMNENRCIIMCIEMAVRIAYLVPPFYSLKFYLDL